MKAQVYGRSEPAATEVMATPVLRTAAIQMRSTADRDANLDLADGLVRQAATEGTRLIVLPENFGWIDREGNRIEGAETLADGRAVGWSRELARELNVYLVAGSIALKGSSPDRVTNSCLVWGPDGTLVARYDKIHLFDIDLDAEHSFRESRFVEPGASVVTVDVDGWRVGLSVCYDLRFPELYRRLVADGADILLVPAAFTARTGRDHWDVLLRARAIENQCWVVAAAQWGRHNERRESYGHSTILDPWGETAASVPRGDGVAVADLRRDRLEAVRRALPALLHRRL